MRRHYTNYFRSLPGVKQYRSKLVTEHDIPTLLAVMEEIRNRYSGFEFERQVQSAR
jgi:tRNA-dihydrouridine synthase B